MQDSCERTGASGGAIRRPWLRIPTMLNPRVPCLTHVLSVSPCGVCSRISATIVEIQCWLWRGLPQQQVPRTGTGHRAAGLEAAAGMRLETNLKFPQQHLII